MKLSVKQLAVLVACLSALPGGAKGSNQKPKAPHLVYRVGASEEVELDLRGYDKDGDKLVTTITKLPAAGELFDLSQVYATHGRPPKAVASGKIAGGSHVIPQRSKARVVFRAPANFQLGAWGTLKYVVSDGQQTSAEGVVTLVSSELPDHVVQASDFRDGSEGWQVVQNGATATAPIHEASSHQVLNHFVYGSDNRLDIDPAGHDRSLWYFSAPAKFLGFQAPAYGGSLKFSLGAFSGDYAPAKRNPNLDLVVLECSACAMGRGMRFAYRFSQVTFDGAPKAFSLLLSERGGWLKDPKNTLTDWAPPTDCEFVEMLDNLSALRILGDHTSWYESVGLDDVLLTSAVQGSKHSVPIKCLCANPGTQCSA